MEPFSKNMYKITSNKVNFSIRPLYQQSDSLLIDSHLILQDNLNLWISGHHISFQVRSNSNIKLVSFVVSFFTNIPIDLTIKKIYSDFYLFNNTKLENILISIVEFIFKYSVFKILFINKFMDAINSDSYRFGTYTIRTWFYSITWFFYSYPFKIDRWCVTSVDTVNYTLQKFHSYHERLEFPLKLPPGNYINFLTISVQNVSL